MLYYARDHALKQPFGNVLASIERFLALAGEESRPPIHAGIRISESLAGHERHRTIRSDSMQLKRGFDFQQRVNDVLGQVRERSNDPHCAFDARWVPDFHGPSTSSFEILGIDRAQRQDGGTFAHFIQISGNGPGSATPNYAMLYLALPFEFDSEAFREFTGKANDALCFKLSPNAFRQLLHAKNGSFRTAKLANPQRQA